MSLEKWFNDTYAKFYYYLLLCSIFYLHNHLQMEGFRVVSQCHCRLLTLISELKLLALASFLTSHLLYCCCHLWEISSEKLNNSGFSVFPCAGPSASQSDHCRDSWDASLVKTVPATLFICIGGYLDLKIARHGIRSRIFIYELLSVYGNCVNLLM